MSRPRWVVTLLVVGACASGTVAGTAVAGGWAVTSLDTLRSAPTAGAPADVAFTVRQHGVTPVTIDDVAIEIVAPDGTVTAFPGVPQEVTGRYVARLTFPEPGTWRWRAVQGVFGPQELGTIRVGGTSAGTGDAGGGAAAGGWTAALLGVAIVGATGIAVVTATRGRRARTGDGALG